MKNTNANLDKQWVDICHFSDLTPDTGVCALFPSAKGDQQVAIFLERLENKLYAVSNYDPIGKAYVMSRGMLASIAGDIVVASPLYKQHYSLVSGQCIEDSQYCLEVFPVRECEGRIQLLACD